MALVKSVTARRGGWCSVIIEDFLFWDARSGQSDEAEHGNDNDNGADDVDDLAHEVLPSGGAFVRRPWAEAEGEMDRMLGISGYRDVLWAQRHAAHRSSVSTGQSSHLLREPAKVEEGREGPFGAFTGSTAQPFVELKTHLLSV